jgi:hypothetical protein
MTTTDTTVNNLIINTMTQAQYSQITPSANELYLVTDSTITSSEVTTALGYTPESTSNKVTSISSSSTDTEYPSAKSVVELLKTIYPVGAIFIGTTATCPMSALFGTWELVAEDRCLQGSSTNHSANTTIAAGLPNITGSQSGIDMRIPMTSLDALSAESDTDNKKLPGNGSYNASILNFNANSSNTIYGNSSTVQPPAYVVNVWRRTA